MFSCLRYANVRTMTAHAYCRIPSILFESVHEIHPTPLNDEKECGHTGVQPVRYRDVVLKHATHDGVFKIGDRLEFCDVDWLTGSVHVYLDADDAESRIVYAEATFCLQCSGLPCEVYADEISALYRRGHSLTNPQCTCVHSLAPSRALQLGIKPARSGRCSCARQAIISDEMIGIEIAVRNWRSYVDADGVHLPTLLHELQIGVTASTIDDIRSPDDLIGHLRGKWPFPTQLPPPGKSYAGIYRDSRRLHKARKLTMLPSNIDGEWSLFYVDDMGLQIDSDVRQLWWSA